MAGNKAGGLKCRDKNLARDPDFYKKIGKKGGSAFKTKPCGFATFSKEKRSECGRKGGQKSRNGGRKPKYVLLAEHIDDILRLELSSRGYSPDSIDRHIKNAQSYVLRTPRMVGERVTYDIDGETYNFLITEEYGYNNKYYASKRWETKSVNNNKNAKEA